MFNIIDHKSNYKADFIILKNEPFRQAEFDRRKKIQFLDTQVFIVSPEDLLLSKLIWIQEIQSSIQLSDIQLLLAYRNLDKVYIDKWVQELKLNTFGLL
jgi:hypothetical protein